MEPTPPVGHPRATGPRLASLGRWLWLAAAAAVPLSTVYFVAQAYSPFLYSDQWIALEWLRKIYDGTAGLAALWEPHNEHSIVFPRLLYLADALLFHATNVILVPANVLLQGAACVTIAREAGRADGLPRPLRVFLAGVALMLLGAAVQIENLYWGFQVAFTLAFTPAVASIVCWVAFADSGAPTGRRNWWWFVGSVACGIVSTFSLANGILIWPVLVGLSCAYGFRARATLFLAGIVAVVVGARVAAGFPGTDVGAVLAAPGRVALVFLLYLGTPFAWLSIPATRVLGTVGVALALAVGVNAFWSIRRLTRFTAVHLAVVAYVVASGLATTVGRLWRPLSWIVSDRYATPALLFWVGVLSLLIAEANRLGPRARRVALAAIIGPVLVAIAFGLLPAHVRAGRGARLLVREYERATLPLITGVYDREQVGLLWIQPEVLPAFVPFARNHRLGVFSLDWPHLLGRPLEEAYVVVSAPPAGTRVGCVGRFERLVAIPPDATLAGTATGHRVVGWAWDRAAAQPPALILLVDGTQTVRGFALPYVQRADIAAQYAGALRGRLRDAGWFGYVTGNAAGPLSAYALAGEGNTVYRLAGPGAG